MIRTKDSSQRHYAVSDNDEENANTSSDCLDISTSTAPTADGAAAATMASRADAVAADDGGEEVNENEKDITNRSHRFLPEKVTLPHIARPATKSPSETLKAVYSAGKYKANLTLDVLAVQSFMAGVYIAMAGQLFLSVGGGILGAALFAAGLIAVVLTSGELFTGDALIFVAALLGGQVKPTSVLRNWTVSWFLNFAGCLAWGYILGYCSDALEDLGKAEYAIAVAQKKAGQTFLGTFLKGIGANFMVCVGVWQATCAEEVSGKVLALWFPITGFVAMGFDHCIANQFFIPLGMMMGADISVVDMLFGQLLPATLGNLVGGGIFVGAIYWYVFDSMQTFNAFRAKIRQGWGRQRASMVRRRSSVFGTRRLASGTVAVEPKSEPLTPSHIVTRWGDDDFDFDDSCRGQQQGSR